MHEVLQRVLHALLKSCLLSPTPHTLTTQKTDSFSIINYLKYFFILQFKEPHNPFFFHVLFLPTSIIRACKCQCFNKNRFKFKW